MELGKLGVWYFTENMPAAAAAETAQRIEELGYSTLWIPETVGRHPLVHASWLLGHTKTLNIATGIASIYNREPGVTVAAQHTLAEQSGDRFLLGLGVSHVPLVEGVRGLTYGKPVATMRKYLEGMDASLYVGPKHDNAPSRVIAALGPKMLELARDMCAGAHPYFVSPDHTVMARETLGAEPLLCVEQKVIFETDAAKARELARANAKTYINLPNYRNNWLRMGLSDDDFENGGSDRFIDATYAWGDVNTIKTRVNEHFQAGANHVCVQPVNPNGTAGDLHWHALEELRDTVA